MRLRFPVDSSPVLALHVWQWPQCLGLFVLGVAAAKRGWLDPVPVRLRRAAGIAALAGPSLMITAFAVSHDSPDP